VLAPRRPTLSDGISEVTRLLKQHGGSNATMLGELMPLVYEELRVIASRQLGASGSAHTLNATALVHESYLKLVNERDCTWQNRAHFLSVAAVAMRHILVSYARRRNAQKRGGSIPIATFDEAVMGAREVRADELLALDEALERLDRVSPRQRAIVECRFFGGLTHEEIAEVVGISVPTVQRDWRLARAWLTRELRPEPA
jgi:RNA polymerase sigma factor (TIGR02999 family)